MERYRYWDNAWNEGTATYLNPAGSAPFLTTVLKRPGTWPNPANSSSGFAFADQTFYDGFGRPIQTRSLWHWVGGQSKSREIYGQSTALCRRVRPAVLWPQPLTKICQIHPCPTTCLAPWWTDLDLGAGGNWYVAVLSAGPNQYTVYEWENVPRFGDNSSTFTFQIWVQNNTDNIWFVYAGFAGNTNEGTVGAENSDGTIGDTYYFEGTGTSPWGGSDLGVSSAPGAPGETHVITFSARGKNVGTWTNCAEMATDIF